MYEKSLRLFIAPFIFIYGIVKPWQFQDAFTQTTTPTNELGGMSLMWAFFGYSLAVPLIVGFFECVGAILLLFDRTKLFGALLLLPVLVNIVMFNLVYEVMSLPTVNSIFYLVVVLFVCFNERTRLKKAAAQLWIVNDIHAAADTDARMGFSLKRVFAMIGLLLLNVLVFVCCQELGRRFL